VISQAGIAAMITGTPGAIAAATVRLPWAIPIVVATLAIGCFSVPRAWRLSLEVTADDVTVSNYWRTYCFPWSRVQAVRIGAVPMGVIPAPAFLFTFMDGKSVRAQATPQKEEGQLAAFELLESIAPPGIEFRR
jgi:hypothetical protein